MLNYAFMFATKFIITKIVIIIYFFAVADETYLYEMVHVMEMIKKFNYFFWITKGVSTLGIMPTILV